MACPSCDHTGLNWKKGPSAVSQRTTPAAGSQMATRVMPDAISTAATKAPPSCRIDHSHSAPCTSSTSSVDDPPSSDVAMSLSAAIVTTVVPFGRHEETSGLTKAVTSCAAVGGCQVPGALAVGKGVLPPIDVS